PRTGPTRWFARHTPTPTSSSRAWSRRSTAPWPRSAAGWRRCSPRAASRCRPGRRWPPAPPTRRPTRPRLRQADLLDFPFGYGTSEGKALQGTQGTAALAPRAAPAQPAALPAVQEAEAPARSLPELRPLRRPRSHQDQVADV